MRYLILFLISFASMAQTHIKVVGTTIMGHDYKATSEATIQIPSTVLINTKGQYKYKYVSGNLVLLTGQEVLDHPFAIEKRIKIGMSKERRRIEKTAKINRGGVNSNLLYLIKRIRPGVSIALDKKVLGDGKSLYQRLQMTGKPTFSEFQSELTIYKLELINALE